MKSLSVNFWPKCSNACIFCFCKEKDFITEKIDASVISSPLKMGEALLENKAECSNLILSGNEPTLNPDLFLAIMLARRIGYSVEIRTNGRMFKDKNFCTKILKTEVDRICITVLSSDAKTHDFLSGAKGAFAETSKGIKNLISLGAGDKVTLYNVITQYNYKQLKKTTEFFSKMGAESFQFNCVYHTSEKIVPKFSEMTPYLHAALKFIKVKKHKTGVYGMPLCFLGEYRDLAVEFHLNNEVILEGRIKDYHHLRKDLGKKRANYCSGCQWENVCEGTWKSYCQVYGEEEFKNKKI